jgi:predicted ATPase
MGESVYRLGPLDVPPAHSELSGAQWLGWTAVRLFIERAGIDSDRPISDAKLSSIADICRRLEGNPLAIEIAAANFDTLGIEGLVAGLHNHLHLSLDGRRTALRRHRTLRAMLDWSYELLSPAEQATLRALSVFTNRFDLESASAVAGLGRTTVFEYLIGFTRKSLVLSSVDDGETVFHLPDLSRAYALEKLRDAGEWAVVRSRHAGHDGSFQRMTGMTAAILKESASEDSSIATPAEQFAKMLQKEFAPETAEDLSGIERAVQVLAEQALHDPTVISEDPVATIKAIIAKLDTRIAQQVNLIAQHGRRQ